MYESGCSFAGLVVLGLIAWAIYAFSVRRAEKADLEQALKDLRAALRTAMKDLGQLGGRLAQLEQEVAELRRTGDVPRPAEALPEVLPAVLAEAAAPEPPPLPEAEPGMGVTELPPVIPPEAADTQPLVYVDLGGAVPPPEEPLPAVGEVPPPVPAAAEQSVVPPPIRWEMPKPAPERPSLQLRSFDWESLIGVKLFSWIAGVALLVAAIAFLKYSLEHGWMSPSVRMAIGLLTGAGLLGACETKRAQAYGVTAQSLTAAGIAILFSTFYASTALWHLMPPTGAFACMVLVTAVAVALSIRRDSIFIALLGLLGGFLTPALLSTGTDNPIGLFGYLGLLNVGLAWVGYRRRWPLLKALSLVFTTLYQLGWVVKFLDSSKLGIGLGVFLLFPVIAFGALFLGERRPQAEDEIHPWFRHSATFAAIPPLLFALHLASTPAYGTHYAMMFGFLALVATGLAAVAAFHGPEWLHTLGAASVLLTWTGWLSRNYRSEAWPAVLGFLAGFVILYLAVPPLMKRLGRPAFEGQGRLAPYAAPLLLAVFPALIALEPAAASPWLPFGTLLVLGLLLAAHALRMREPWIHYLACFFMIVAEAVWSVRCLTPERLLPALGIYGVFALFTLGVPLLARSRDREPGPGEGAPFLLLALPPLLFSVICLALPDFAGRFMPLFGFLALLDIWLAVLGLRTGLRWLPAVGGGFTLGAWAVWLAAGYSPAAWPSALAFVALFVGIFLGADAWTRRRSEPGTPVGLAVYTAPLLMFVFPVLALIEPAVATPGLYFGGVFALLLALAFHAVRHEEGLVHFLACFFVLLAEALWSARHLAPHNLLTALAVYGGFGLFYLGVPLVAASRGKVLRPEGSGAILSFVSLGLLFFLVFGPMAAMSLWPLAVLIGLLNLGLLHESSQGHHPVLCMTGMILSWILLGCWWFSAPVEGLLLPALVVMGAFGLLVVGGNLWLRTRKEPAAGAGRFSEPGLFLGLAGHLFLFAVVLQPRLSLPPWPWLGVLSVLVLALGTASLYLRRGALHLASLLATQLVLVVWAAALPAGSPWLPFALWPPVLFGWLGWLWDELARHRGSEDEHFGFAAGAGIHVAQLALVILGQGNRAVPHGSLVLAHGCLALALLVLAWRWARHGWALSLAVSMGLVLPAWRLTHAFAFLPGFWIHAAWREELLLAGVFYGLLLLFPLALGARGRASRLPWVAALVGSGLFFLAAWEALLSGGYAAVIGALPVVQALLLVPHLLVLLRLEPDGERDLGRLAAVAGGILAFVTVAIPLQLDKEWITLGWALLGAALAWLYTRVPHKGLLAWVAGLLAAVFARLVLNPAVFEYHPRTGFPVLNWYLYTYLVAAACCFAAARILRDEDDRIRGLPRLSGLLPVGGGVLLFLLLNIEIADAFSEGEALTFNLFHGSLAQQLSYTIGWACYSIGLLVCGVVSRRKLTRVAAIIMLTGTVLKAFVLDLRQLSGLYRVASFVGLALSLALVAVVLQQFVLRRTELER